MRAAVIDEHNSFKVETVDDPVPQADELVLRVTGCGICGSDLKSRPAMPGGTVMGHEFCGEVVAVGTGATGQWKEGMRAAALPVMSCGTCAWCQAGDVAHCAEVAPLGFFGEYGGFAELVRTSADLSVVLPESLPESYGPLVEPFAVGLHTVRMAEISAGDDVLVVGGGPVGLANAAWARQLGAGSVTVSDPVEMRREAAAAFGATAAVDPTKEELGGPYDVVIECVGKPGLLDVCVQATRTQGRIVVAGVCTEPDPFLPMAAVMKEVTLRFAVYYRPEEFRAVITAFADGRIDPEPMVTRTIGLDGLDEAFAGLLSAPTDLKVMVDPTAAAEQQ